MSAIHRYAASGDLEKLRQELRGGANVNSLNIRGVPALVIASGQGHLASVRELLQWGALVDLPDKGGWTALHKAAFHGYCEVVKLLAEAGCDLNRTTRDGSTAATLAGQLNHSEVVEALRKFGADMTLRDPRGRTSDDCLAIGGAFAEVSKEIDRLRHEQEHLDNSECKVRSLMEEGSPEKWAAHHGFYTGIFSYGSGSLDDPEAAQWAKRVSEILQNTDLLVQCEAEHLEAEEFEKRQAVRKRWRAADERRARQKERIRKIQLEPHQ